MATTFGQIFYDWTRSVTQRVQSTTRRNLSGGGRGALKTQTGRTRNSIQYSASGSPDEANGDVFSNYPVAYIWEVTGVQGPLSPTNGAKAMVMPIRVGGILVPAKLRNALSTLKGKVRTYTAIFRARTYTITRYKRPTKFMTNALMEELDGYKGQVALNRLGAEVGAKVADDIANGISVSLPNVNVSMRP
jgi:hypothetical protein